MALTSEFANAAQLEEENRDLHPSGQAFVFLLTVASLVAAIAVLAVMGQVFGGGATPTAARAIPPAVKDAAKYPPVDCFVVGSFDEADLVKQSLSAPVSAANAAASNFVVINTTMAWADLKTLCSAAVGYKLGIAIPDQGPVLIHDLR